MVIWKVFDENKHLSVSTVGNWPNIPFQLTFTCPFCERKTTMSVREKGRRTLVCKCGRFIMVFSSVDGRRPRRVKVKDAIALYEDIVRRRGSRIKTKHGSLKVHSGNKMVSGPSDLRDILYAVCEILPG